MTCEPKFKNALIAVEMMFKSLQHNMNSPTNTPTNNDKTVSFVINANAIATRGGNNVKIPNLTELSASAGVVDIHNDKTKRSIIETAVTNPNFIFSFIYYHTIFPIHLLK